MSLRRPRIKSAVNLAALANGRRKAPGLGEKAADQQKEVEPVEQTAQDGHDTENETRKTVVENETSDEPKTVNVSNCEEQADVAAANEEVCFSEKAEADVYRGLNAIQVSQDDQSSSSKVKESCKDSNSHADDNPGLLESLPHPAPPIRPTPVAHFKPRFRPNLNENGHRIRRNSGTLTDLVSLCLSRFDYAQCS